MIYTQETHMGTRHRRSMRHVAPIYRSNPIGVYGQEDDGATGGFVSNHPWLTFFIVLAGISTVGAILGANRY